VICAGALAWEWLPDVVNPWPANPIPRLLVEGVLLCSLAAFFRLEDLGLSRNHLVRRLIGGLGLAVVLLLPAAARWHGGPPLALATVPALALVSIGEEIAFRGAVFTVLDRIGGGMVAVLGSTVLFTAGHAFSHPLAVLPAVAAAGLVLGAWRWATSDLVGPILAHLLANLSI
jgi:hypothetical protein